MTASRATRRVHPGFCHHVHVTIEDLLERRLETREVEERERSAGLRRDDDIDVGSASKLLTCSGSKQSNAVEPVRARRRRDRAP